MSARRFWALYIAALAYVAPLAAAQAQSPVAPPNAAQEPSPIASEGAPAQATVESAEQQPAPVVTPLVAAEPLQLDAAANPAATSDEMVMTELAKLGLDAAADGGVVDTSLKFSGFADFALTGVFGREGDWRGAYERFSAFSIGNFNLYTDKRLLESLRMFGEIRFTFLPNGTAPPGAAPGDYQQTGAEDYANFKRPVSWAGIYIPRVYLEWTPYRFFGVRGGVILTPYGIWNVDHGSPTIIPVQRPFVVGQALFPERQTGIELLGQFDIGHHSTIGYHLTLTNGLGAVNEYRDYDDNKAIGGRLYWSFDGLGQLRVGASAFYGQDTTAHEMASFAPDGQHVVFTQKIDQQSDVLALAGDVQWKYRGLHLQTELITQQRRYKDAARPGSSNPFFGRYLAPSDRLNWGIYGLVGYRFDWFGIMPYFLAQFMDAFDPAAGALYFVNSFFAGINIRPIDVLVIKIEYNQSHFPRGFIIAGDTQLGQVQVAWAF